MDKQIQWFPGHMAKAYRLIKEKISLVDVVIELIDSRCPFSSLNETLNEIIGNKPLLIVMNKADLADKKQTLLFKEELSKRHKTIVLNSLNGTKNLEEITNAIETLLKDKIIKMKAQGKNIYPLRAMVIGIPNVGKSTLLNNLSKRRALNVGDRPGVTKNMQYLKANDRLLLLDNPGTLWPKFKDQTQAKLIALIGSIKDDILPLEEIALFGIDILKKYYPENLINRYKLEALSSSYEILEQIGKRRGALMKGNIIDIPKTCDLFIKDLRSGKLGEMTFERIE